MLQRPLGLLRIVRGVESRPVGVGPPELHHARDPRLARPAPGVAGHRDRPCGRAVIAAVGGEDLVPPGVQPGHAQRVLRRLGAAVREEDHVEVAWGQVGDEAGRLAPVRVGERRRDRAQPAGGLLDGGHDPRVLVPDVQVDELRGEVQVAPAFVVPEPRALAAGDRDRGQRPLRAPRVEHVGPVVLEDGRAVGTGFHSSHGAPRSERWRSAESVRGPIGPEQSACCARYRLDGRQARRGLPAPFRSANPPHGGRLRGPEPVMEGRRRARSARLGCGRRHT